MIYHSYQDTADIIRRSAWKIPHDVELIVGIPRSGMIPALMLAELLNKRCADLDAFVSGREMSFGVRGGMMQYATTETQRTERRKVLVIDDSVYSGNAMRKARARLEPLSWLYDITYCCVFAESRRAKDMVDIWLEDISGAAPGMILKEWNIMHLPCHNTEASMWDIDGLLCKDPPDDRDTAAYEAYLPNAIPMIIPTTNVGALVTFRLEKYRSVTDWWLQRHGVSYRRLLMVDVPDRDTRNRTVSSAHYKARHYRDAVWAQLFIESDARQAEKIHIVSGKPVFCYENGKMYL